VVQLEWFSTVAAFVEGLFSVSHVGPGGVPRGREAETLLTQNTAAAPRGLYSINGFLAGVISYAKTQHMTGSNKIVARFHMLDVARPFLYYLVIIRPLEKKWAKQLFTRLQSKTYRSVLFVRLGNPMKSGDFANVLKSFTAEELKFPMALADYRQVIKVILRIVLGMEVDEDDEDEIHAIDVSFGHSTRRGRGDYGRLKYSDLHTLTSEVMTMCQIDCEKVHRWLQGSGRRVTSPISANTSGDPTQMVTQAEIEKIIRAAIEKGTSDVERAAMDICTKSVAAAQKSVMDVSKVAIEAIEKAATRATENAELGAAEKLAGTHGSSEVKLSAQFLDDL
jgi:hypothetical protein